MIVLTKQQAEAFKTRTPMSGGYRNGKSFIQNLIRLQDKVNIYQTILLRAMMIENYINSPHLRGSIGIWDFANKY